MALSKITLTLGKKVITLTSKEFEELKRDMRELDKDHHYYWHRYDRWYYHNTPNLVPQYAGLLGAASLGNLLIEPNNQDGTVSRETFNTEDERYKATIKTGPTPPPFSGSVLSTE